MEKLAEEGVIGIETTDTPLNELEKNKSYPQGIKKGEKYIFSMGSFVLGHSKFGSSILGSKEDGDQQLFNFGRNKID